MRKLRLQEAYGLEVAQESSISTEETTSDDFKGYVIANLAAIHAGTTKNNTVYGADKLRGDEEKGTGVASWTSPYKKPVLTHHNKHGEPIGRVLEAHYMSGKKPFIKLKVKVSDEDAAKKVLDGRYDTVSIGAETDSAICSICGTDIVAEGFCGHWRGETYEGETARWILGDLWFNEVSYVNVPADQEAGTLTKELFTESAEGEVVEKLGDGTAILIVVPDDDNKPLKESVQESVDDTNHSEEGETELPEDNKPTVEEQLETLRKENDQLKSDNEDLQEKLENAEKERDSYKESAETLEAEKQDLVEEKDRLLEDVNKKAEELHEAMAERIVDMRIALGKPMQEESREEEVKKYAGRSQESLNDTMADIALEYKNTLPGVRDQIESANNPGAAVQDGTEPQSQIEGVKTNEDDDDLSPEEIQEKTAEVLKGLFSGGRK